MKKIYFLGILLLILTATTFAQSGHVFILNKLSNRDTLLSGWTIQPGDNPQWAQPDFNDSNWPVTDPGQDIQDFTQFRNTGIVWIRLHVRVDEKIANQQFLARIMQFAASEIYLNGKLIFKYGTVSANPEKVIAYLPPADPTIIKLLPGNDNLIAVRLAYQPNLPYISNVVTPSAFRFYINNYQGASAGYRDFQHGLMWFIIIYTLSGGMLFIISVIHLVYFLFDRSQKVHLYYFLFCVLLSYQTLPNEIWGAKRVDTELSIQVWMFFANGVAVVVGMLFLMVTIYTLFNYHRRTIFKILILTGAVMIGSMFFISANGYFMCANAFPLLCLAEGVYICIWAIKRKKRDAYYILPGILLFTVFTIASSVVDQSGVFAQVFYALALICFPIAMSFYLGVQNSFKNKKLQAMLVEVQELSNKTIAQEQEKQQLLETQNELLEQQVGERTAELSRSLIDLKSTQTQLVQKEKMASLGELTAGIAHEIQNPLNFVNNFSEVNTELVIEMMQEIEKGDLEEIKAIAIDIEENSKKISMHGKRADSIVKGMLEHSRVGTGEKQPTDLNALADEFLRLSYHGLRSKDKSFNAELVTQFDPALPKANVVQQDIGRVLLNLFNNAFYAVNQKQKTAGDDYKPEVSVSTSVEKDRMIIKVRDNGNGIPAGIKDKIMQPFFTTKPTGGGTGLGLSLSYDIVVKGHGGSIDVETKIGEYTEFIVSLPLS